MITELCQTLKFMNTISFLALFIEDTLVGLHPPHLPLALMGVNLSVNEILLVFSYTKVQMGLLCQKRGHWKSPFGSRFLIFFPSHQNWNLTSFVFDCELLPLLWLPLCLYPSISNAKRESVASALIGEIPFPLNVHIYRIHVIVCGSFQWTTNSKWPYLSNQDQSAF